MSEPEATPPPPTQPTASGLTHGARCSVWESIFLRSASRSQDCHLEKRKSKYNTVTQNKGWTGLYLVSFVFLMHRVINKTPIFYTLLLCCMAGSTYIYIKKKPRSSLKILRMGPNYMFPSSIASGLGTQGKQPHMLLCKTNPQITGWLGKQTPPCPAMERGQEKKHSPSSPPCAF